MIFFKYQLDFYIYVCYNFNKDLAILFSKLALAKILFISYINYFLRRNVKCTYVESFPDLSPE